MSSTPISLAARMAVASPETPLESIPDVDVQPELDERGFVKISAVMQITNLLVIILPFMGFVAASVLLWGRLFNWVHLGLLIGFYIITVFGVTVGYHRLFTHRAFETHPILQALFAWCGSLSLEGSLFRWVATHRRHHQTSDTEADPHSPHLHGDGFGGIIAGLWHAHCGWLFEPHVPGLDKYVADLNQCRMLRIISKLFPLWALVSLGLPALLGGLFTHSWIGALLGFIWGGLARVFLVHHVTWSINSVCHLWGGRPFKSGDESRNNLVFGLLAFGEGWHNNHHAFPTSARHGLFWWQIDLSWLLIRAMKAVGLAWNVRLPAPAALAVKRRTK